MRASIANGRVAELIPDVADFDGQDVGIAERFHPDFVASLKEAGPEVQLGWIWDGSVFAPPSKTPAPPAVPPEISRRQMLLAMQLTGLITGPEALAAATVGAVPAAIDAVFSKLPAARALAARVTWATMGKAERNHELILVLIQAELATPAEVDAIFVAGAAIL